MTHATVAINPHATQPTSPVALDRSLWRNRQRITQMTKREVVGRYKGSVFALFNSYLHAVFIPLVLFPIGILTLGLSWLLASLGVFLRDVGQTIGVITTVLMFLSPVVYPITAVPERLRPWLPSHI